MASRNKLSTKIILMVEGILLISSILFCTVSVYRARVGIRKAIQQRMLDIANCASGSVNGDKLKTLSEDTVGSTLYSEIYDKLAVFRDNVELEYVYSIKQAGEKHFIFTMDLDPVSPASYGDTVEYTEALDSAGKGTAAVDEIPYTDKWGEFYSAYSPVFDSSGNVAGIVAVDFSVEWFDGQLSEQTKSTVISYVIILIFSLLLAAGLAILTLRPFVRMQEELIEEKVRAESANHAKTDFLANMSHEIRTPINAVLGMNEMILRESRKTKDLDDGNAEAAKEALRNIVVYAGDVENAGHNLLAIVNDILDFSKIEAGRMDLVQSPYKLSSLLNNISNMMLCKAQDKKLDFIIDVDQNLPDELCGDEVRVRQILTNLLNNAVKYTEKGSISLTVRGEIDEEEDDIFILKVSIRDTGIGIRTEDKEKLFNKFERLDMERNSTLEGTGLGLVITKRLLDMMDGTIHVKSDYGKGSVFTVTIPQKIINKVPVGDFQKRFETSVRETKNYKETFRAPQARILIVDDTRINLTVAVNLLKNTKIRVDTAISGAEAVELAEKNEYDLILMDQRMPEMEGTEALKKIRSSESGASRNTPVICLTADAVIGAKERYLAEGFSDYLTKPIESYSLERMLMKYLPQEKVERVKMDGSDASSGKDPDEGDFGILRRAGIEPRTGLLYCQNDEDFYRSVLAEYAYAEAEKTESLKRSFEAENWHDYSIYVHALKSTSKMIGASALSNKAARLESAANDGDSGTIRAEHETLLREYKEVAEAILSITPDAEPEDEEGDVFEFLPDPD